MQLSVPFRFCMKAIFQITEFIIDIRGEIIIIMLTHWVVGLQINTALDIFSGTWQYSSGFMNAELFSVWSQRSVNRE